MQYEYINKQDIAGQEYHDLIITDDNWVERISIKTSGQDKDLLAQEVYEKILAEKEKELIRKNTFTAIEELGASLIAYIASNPVSLDNLAAMNTLVNTALNPLGISITAPDVKQLILLRVKNSFEKILEDYKQMNITQETFDDTLVAIQQIKGGLGI